MFGVSYSDALATSALLFSAGSIWFTWSNWVRTGQRDAKAILDWYVDQTDQIQRTFFELVASGETAGFPSVLAQIETVRGRLELHFTMNAPKIWSAWGKWRQSVTQEDFIGRGIEHWEQDGATEVRRAKSKFLEAISEGLHTHKNKRRILGLNTK